jgi:hypothetical protein
MFRPMPTPKALAIFVLVCALVFATAATLRAGVFQTPAGGWGVTAPSGPAPAPRPGTLPGNP